MDSKNVTVHKRQQIVKANRMMFLWVAGASVVIGFALVLSLFLGQRIIYGEKVLKKQGDTVRVLEKNAAAIQQLEDNIRILDTNEGLKVTRLNDTDRPIQSVLDALPADANSTALGASLQAKLVSNIAGLTLDSLKVDPVEALEAEADDDDASSSTTTNVDSSENSIQFSMTVSTATSNPDALREVLTRIERSIRAIDIRSLSITTQSSRLTLTVSGKAFYQPAKTIELRKQAVKP